jgi:hypothetical protein
MLIVLSVVVLLHFNNGIHMSNIRVAQQAQQKKADGLPDPNKREGPVKTAQDIYEENGLGVMFCIIPCCNVPYTGMSLGTPGKLCCVP